MKKLISRLFVVFIYILFSCNSVPTEKNQVKSNNADSEINHSDSNKVFSADWKTLTKDFMTWYTYTYYNVRLSQDFIALDTDSTKIDKTTFLNKLMTGNTVAFKIKILQGEPVYKLYNLNSNDESIRTTVKQMALTEMVYFKMEGTKLPEFNFTDLNGKTYDWSSTKGKIIVLKCWFIHCVPCIQEFPELNKLVDDYKSRNDILFISLAMDAKVDLIKFLETKQFKYAVIPEMKSYMVDKLNITAFPTHLLIDKNGIIIKVVNRIDDLIPFLKRN